MAGKNSLAKLDAERDAFFTAMRHTAAAMMRADGLSYGQIGERLGMNRQAVQKMMDRALEQVAGMDETAIEVANVTPMPVGPDHPRSAAVDLRMAGWSYAQIAAETEQPEQTIRTWVEEELLRRQALEIRSVDLIRRLEAERLDALQRGVWNRAINGDDKAIELVLKIMHRRSKLEGLDQIPPVDILTEIRTVALEVGVDPDDAVMEAEVLLERVRKQMRAANR